jgi:two-component sensor histidine kinase
MFREVQHRIKNNMYSMAAILSLKADGMTDSIKYAFDGRTAGTIHLSSRIDADRGRRRVHVRIADNGSGDAPGTASGAEADAGLGITLMRSLAAQLGGSFSPEYSAGTTVSVDFPISA